MGDTQTVATADIEQLWAGRFVAYLNSVTDVTELTYEGIGALTGVPRLLEAMRRPEEEVARAREQSGKAQAQMDAQFALFHAQAIMGLWGALEAAIEELGAEWLKHRPEVLNGSRLDKLRVPIALLNADEEDRNMALVREINRSIGSDLKLGVGQFEGFLDAMGLGGGLPANMRQVLLFTQQYRHLVAHRGGRVDQRFKAACPFEAAIEGETLNVGASRFALIRTALIGYVALLMDRFRVASGEPSQDDPQYWENQIARLLETERNR
jgi:hypothetical protein